MTIDATNPNERTTVVSGDLLAPPGGREGTKLWQD
jgi:hypothetical protein